MIPAIAPWKLLVTIPPIKGDIIASESVGFFVGAPETPLELTPTPLEQLPTPTSSPEPEPRATPHEEIDMQNTQQYLVTEGAIAFTVAVIVSGLGLLASKIKRK